MLKWLQERATSILYYAYQSRYFHNFLSGFIQPVSQLPRALSQINESQNIKTVIKQTIKTSAPIFLISMTYYKVVRPSLLCVAEEDSYSLWVMDMAVNLHLARQLPRFFINDAVNTISFVDATNATLKINNEHFECKHCDPVLMRHANFKTNIYYPAYSLFLFLISNYPYMGKVSSWVLNPWLLGHTLLDYRLNMCDFHRYQLISENNAWLIGVGTLINLTAWKSNQLVGADSFFTLLALQALIIKISLMTILLQEQRLPGKEYSCDLLYYPRLTATEIIQCNINRLHRYIIYQSDLQKKQKSDKNKHPAELYNNLKEYLSIVAKYLLGKPYSELNTLVQTDAIRLLIQLKSVSIKAFLTSLKNTHDHPYVVSVATKIIRILPSALLPSGVSKEEIRIFKKVIYLNATKTALPVVIKLINHALEDPIKLQEIEEERALLLSKEKKDDDTQNKLVAKWGNLLVQEEIDDFVLCNLSDSESEEPPAKIETIEIKEVFFAPSRSALSNHSHFSRTQHGHPSPPASMISNRYRCPERSDRLNSP